MPINCWKLPTKWYLLWMRTSLPLDFVSPFAKTLFGQYNVIVPTGFSIGGCFTVTLKFLCHAILPEPDMATKLGKNSHVWVRFTIGEIRAKKKSCIDVSSPHGANPQWDLVDVAHWTVPGGLWQCRIWTLGHFHQLYHGHHWYVTLCHLLWQTKEATRLWQWWIGGSSHLYGGVWRWPWRGIPMCPRKFCTYSGGILSYIVPLCVQG